MAAPRELLQGAEGPRALLLRDCVATELIRVHPPGVTVLPVMCREEGTHPSASHLRGQPPLLSASFREFWAVLPRNWPPGGESPEQGFPRIPQGASLQRKSEGLPGRPSST